MTILFENRTSDGDSAEHTIAAEVTAIVATGSPWGKARLVLLVETIAGSNQYVADSALEFAGPGVRNFVCSAASGQKIKFMMLDAGLSDCSISVYAN